MKFTVSWLKDHLDTTATLDEIVTTLTAIGLEVESVQDRAKSFAPFRVALIEKADKHPDADRLKVCIVDTGTEKLQVVCGAPNARAGMKGVFAPAGSYIPGTDITLKKGVIRGQESNGMMVSEREMGLSDEHNGIIEVPDNTPLGTPMAELYGLNDPVIEINLTPNRADCAGVRGIARDLAAAGLGTLKPLKSAAVKGGFESPIQVRLDFAADAQNACPLFLGRLIKNVKNVPSPEWLQRRLKAIGLRPISALVDVTNYLSYDLCRPLHVFDADKVKGDIRVRLAKAGEKLMALNDKEYALDDFMTAVCDDSGVLGLGGVMGGSSTGCTAETTSVYIECAAFDPARTAKTGRALQINSDARYRFERGIDNAFAPEAMEIATQLILDLCGGEASHVVTAGAVPSDTKTVSFDPVTVEKLAGFEIPSETQKQILTSLGFTVSGDKIWNVTAPSWRGDIDGKADLVEEIVRIYGYDKMPSVSVMREASSTHSAETPRLTKVRQARTALAAQGLDEAVTWSFMNGDLADQFGGQDAQAAKSLTISNPINAEMDRMRPSLLPNLIQAATRNAARGFPDAALFEVGPAFITAKPDGQKTVAAGIRHGLAVPRHWGTKDAGRKPDGLDAKADAFAVLNACGFNAETAQITRDAPAWYHPARSGTLRLGANVLAYFGDLHPAVLDDMDVKGAVAGFEVFLDSIPQPKKKSAAKTHLTLPPLQPVNRDFAFIVDAAVEAETLVKTIKAVDKTLVARVDVFDVYVGKGIEDGKKSVALSVMLQPAEKTLTDAELEAIAAKIVQSVTEKTKGTLRG